MEILDYDPVSFENIIVYALNLKNDGAEMMYWLWVRDEERDNELLFFYLYRWDVKMSLLKKMKVYGNDECEKK